MPETNYIPINTFMVKILKVSAPGKIILSGEHAVVYGFPAIATAVDKRITIDRNGKIDSDLPIGSGLGSSAAFAVATSAFEINNLDLDEINKRAYEIERVYHGSPSGLDNSTVTYGGFLWYKKESNGNKTIKKIYVKAKLPKFYLLNSGKPDESTKEMVEMVAERYKKERRYTLGIFRGIENVTKGFLEFLTGDVEHNLGELMSENERLLEGLGVVSDKAKNIIRTIEKNGGYAKISGAGGRKLGSGMILIYHRDKDKLERLFEGESTTVTPVRLGENGVKIETE